MDVIDVVEYGTALTAGLLGAVHAAEGNVHGGIVSAIVLELCQAAIAATRCCMRKRRRTDGFADFPETSGVFAGTAACSNAAYHCAMTIGLSLVVAAPWDAGVDLDQFTSGLPALAFTCTVAAAAPFAVLRVASDICVKNAQGQLTMSALATATALTALRVVAFLCSVAAFVYFVSQAQVILAAGVHPLSHAHLTHLATGRDIHQHGRELHNIQEFQDIQHGRDTNSLQAIGQCADQGSDAPALRFVAFNAACGMIISIQVFWTCRGIAFAHALCTSRI